MSIVGIPVTSIPLERPGASAVILANGNSDSPEYSGLEEVAAQAGAQLRIFGKPDCRPGRRMGVVATYGTPNTPVEELVEKARKLADKDDSLRVHELEIDPARFKARLAGAKLELTANEFRVLHFLATHAGWVFTRYQIVNAVRGEDYVVTERAIDVQIAGLRKKLGKYAEYIETVRGIGYRFKE